MTPNQTGDVATLVGKLWPRLKWTEEEQDVFEERVQRLDIEPAQAEAALRNLKATNPKFPQIADLLKALENARSRPVVQAEAPKPVSCRLSEMARRNGLSVATANRVEIVVADWSAKLRASMRIRGHIPDSRYKEFAQDMLELARATERECDEWWFSMVEAVKHVPQERGWDRMSAEQIRARVMRSAEKVEVAA